MSKTATIPAILVQPPKSGPHRMLEQGHSKEITYGNQTL